VVVVKRGSAVILVKTPQESTYEPSLKNAAAPCGASDGGHRKLKLAEP